MRKFIILLILLYLSPAMAAITVHEATMAGIENSTTFTIEKPANVANGDYLVGFVIHTGTKAGDINRITPTGNPKAMISDTIRIFLK